MEMEPGLNAAVLGGSGPPGEGAILGGWEGTIHRHPQPNPSWFRYREGFIQLISLATNWSRNGSASLLTPRKEAIRALSGIPLMLVIDHYNQSEERERRLILEWLGQLMGHQGNYLPGWVRRLSADPQPSWMGHIREYPPKWLTVWRLTKRGRWEAKGGLIITSWPDGNLLVEPRLRGQESRNLMGYKLGWPLTDPDTLSHLVNRYLKGDSDLLLEIPLTSPPR